MTMKIDAMTLEPPLQFLRKRLKPSFIAKSITECFLVRIYLDQRAKGDSDPEGRTIVNQ